MFRAEADRAGGVIGERPDFLSGFTATSVNDEQRVLVEENTKSFLFRSGDVNFRARNFSSRHLVGICFW